MRHITDHQINGEFGDLNGHIDILANDPGCGGASHLYQIHLLEEPDPDKPKLTGRHWTFHIDFQDGPIQEAGVNGVSNEALLAIVADRLRGFQSGSFANGYNTAALDAVESALRALHSRTQERMVRGVEGKLIP